MTGKKNPGICCYCGEEISKNMRSVTAHLNKCKERVLPKTNAELSLRTLVLIEDTYVHEYWMVIALEPDTTFTKLDTFLRDIWLECCGHLSSFETKKQIPLSKRQKPDKDLSDLLSFLSAMSPSPRVEIKKSGKIGSVIEKGDIVDYMYDFGSTTALSVKIIGEIPAPKDKNITVLVRNKAIEFKCSECGKPATLMCGNCIYDEPGGMLCKKCSKSHTCSDDYGAEGFMEIINSPRLGVCGYTGNEEADVKKYFPNRKITG